MKSQLFFTFAKIGLFTFGGGYVMIALLENECVNKKNWLTHDEFMDMTVIAETTPGPVAINCATYIGHKKAGMSGAALATLGVVLPSFLIILLISTYLQNFLQYEVVNRAFTGIRAAVAVLIIRAAVNMIRELLKTKEKYIAKIIFIVLFFTVVLAMNFLKFHISTIYLMLSAGFMGFWIFRCEEKKE